jgi:REP element-mobilizing transposase RayT
VRLCSLLFQVQPKRWAEIMTYARKSLISLQDTPYYHVVARCVRRAWLWGVDEYAGKDYSHRKSWVLERLAQLCSMFAIDICAYAILSNHYHLVLHVDRKRAQGWTLEEVVERWSVLFGVPPLVERWQQGLAGEAERVAAEHLIAIWRARLHDISMVHALFERASGAAGQCGRPLHGTVLGPVNAPCKTGIHYVHVDQGRFKSQALLDEAGLLTAMAYVDLNPIRAGIATTPETSEFTSIDERIRELAKAEADSSPPSEANSKVNLLAFSDAAGTNEQPTIPFRLVDYLQLVDWTGRAIRQDKRGAIEPGLPSILADECS